MGKNNPNVPNHQPDPKSSGTIGSKISTQNSGKIRSLRSHVPKTGTNHHPIPWLTPFLWWVKEKNMPKCKVYSILFTTLLIRTYMPPTYELVHQPTSCFICCFIMFHHHKPSSPSFHKTNWTPGDHPPDHPCLQRDLRTTRPRHHRRQQR